MPGNPTVIVSNMPGGSGINAANFMYNVAPKDGTAIAILIQTMGEEQGLGTEGIRFDVKRFNWIGRVTSNVEMVYVWHTVPVKTIDDVKKRETILASAGPASITYPLLLNDMIGTRFKLVRGYQGTQNTSLAMQRGEVDGATGSIVAVKTLSNWLTSGEINILTQYATKRHRELPNIPAVVELTEQTRGQGATVVSGARLRSRACIRCAARRVAGSTFGLAQGVRCDHGRPGVPGGRQENPGGSRPAAGQGPAATGGARRGAFRGQSRACQCHAQGTLTRETLITGHEDDMNLKSVAANLPVELLRTLVAVNKSGDLVEAAGTLGTAPSEVQAQVAKLEETLGVMVFERSSAGNVRLSDHGKIVSRYAERLLSINDRLSQQLQAPTTATKLRVGLPRWVLKEKLRRDRATLRRRSRHEQADRCAATRLKSWCAMSARESLTSWLCAA